MFPHGTPVTWLHRQADGSFADPVTIPGCAVAPREQLEGPVPSWPPLTSGRTVYAPPGTDVSAKDRMIIAAVTYEVDGDPAVWDNPFTGTRFGVVIQLRRTDWYDAVVTIATYLGSGGFGDTFADPVQWPGNVENVHRLVTDSSGDEVQSAVTVRVPPSNEGVSAVSVFTPGSLLTVDGTVCTVITAQAITRDGIVEFVEVTAK